MTVIIDDLSNMYMYYADMNGSPVSKVTFGGNVDEYGNAMLLDYFRIYAGEPEQVLPYRGYTYYEDFGGYAEGADLINKPIYTRSSILAAAAVDPLDADNLCAKIESTDASAAQKCIIPFFRKYTGKVNLELRVLVNDCSYRHIPTIRSQINDEMLVAVTNTSVSGDWFMIGSSTLYDAIKPGQWTKLRYEFDMDTKEYSVFINDCDYSVKSGVLEKGEDISAISFTVWTDDAATPIYIDDIYVYHGLVPPRTEEGGFSVAAADGIRIGESDGIYQLAALHDDVSEVVYRADNIRDAALYSVRFQIGHGGGGSRSIVLNSTDGTELLNLRFAENLVYADGTVLCGYRVDGEDSPVKDQTRRNYYISIDTMNKRLTVSMDNLAYSYTSVLPGAAELKPDALKFAFEAPVDGGNVMYASQLWIGTGTQIVPGPEAELYSYTNMLENGAERITFDGESYYTVETDGDINYISADQISIPLGNFYEGRFDIMLKLCGKMEVAFYNSAGQAVYTYMHTGGAWCNVLFVFDTEAETVKINANTYACRTEDISCVAISGRKVLFGGIDIKKQIYYTVDEKAAQSEAGRVLSTYLFDCTDRTLKLARGGYRFENTASNTYKKFRLNGISNFDFNGSGSEFWGKDVVSAISLSGCENVSIKNISIDYDPLPFTQGTICAVDDKNKTFDVVIDEGYASPAHNSVDGNFRMIYYKADSSAPLPVTSSDYGTIKEQLGENIFRVAPNFEDAFKSYSKLSVGDRFVFRTELGGASAVTVLRSKQCAFKNIKIYTSPSLCVYETGGFGDHLYENITVTRRPGTDRMVSSAADGFHFRSVGNGSTLKNCEVGYTLDDCLNSYGIFGVVYKKIDDRTYIVGECNPDIAQGSSISFYDCISWEPKAKAIVTSVEEITDEETLQDVQKCSDEITKLTGTALSRSYTSAYKVTFDSDIDVQHLDYAMSDYLCGRGLTVTNCYFHDCYVRGVLLRSPDSVIEGCTFERINNGAIVLLPERHFNEGPFPENIIIRNNTIKDSSYCRWSSTEARYSGVILAVGSPARVVSNTANMAGIEISGNRIENCGATPIMVCNTKDSRISGNIIKGAYADGYDGPESSYYTNYIQLYGIYALNNDNLRISGNTFESRPEFLLSDVYNSEMLPFDILDRGTVWDAENADIAFERARAHDVAAGGSVFVMRPKGKGEGSVSAALAKPLRDDFLIEFNCFGTEDDRKIEFFGADSKPVMIFEYQNNAFSLNGVRVYAESSADTVPMAFYYDKSESTYALYRRGTPMRQGNLSVGEITGIRISSSDEIVYSAFRLWEPATGVAVTIGNGEVNIINTNGQILSDVDLFAACIQDGVLKSVDHVSAELEKYATRVKIETDGVTDVYVWKNMQPQMKNTKDFFRTGSQ